MKTLPVYDHAVLYSGGLDSGATLFHLERNGIVDFDNTLLLHCDYGQVAYDHEVRAIRDMMAWYSYVRGGAFNVHTIRMELYTDIMQMGGRMPDLLHLGKDKNNHTIPWRNYLITLQALAICESLEIGELYTTMGYYDDGGIWDNTPMAFNSLQRFTDEIASQLKNNAPGSTVTRIISPTYNKSRKEWVKQEVDADFPYWHTYSCWYYDGYLADQPQLHTPKLERGSCGVCKCCHSRKAVLDYATGPLITDYPLKAPYMPFRAMMSAGDMG